MSGGAFNHINDRLSDELFPYTVTIDYGLGSPDKEEYRRLVRKANVMHNRQVSELVYDILCLLHSLDWYESGDTGEEIYKKDVNYIISKYFNNKDAGHLDKVIDDAIDDLRKELKCELLGREE